MLVRRAVQCFLPTVRRVKTRLVVVHSVHVELLAPAPCSDEKIGSGVSTGVRRRRRSSL